jgi:hypothetical protein
MSVDILKQTNAEDLCRAIERCIARRTFGRVRRLEVQVSEQRVQVRGQVSSFYVKQLAIQGCLDALGTLAESLLQVDINVSAKS